MTTRDAPPRPTDSEPRRILGPDVARGFMLLLIAMAYAGVYVGAGFGVDASNAPALDRAASLVTVLLLDNRAFPLFAILFGYGLAWSVARRSARGDGPGTQRRVLGRRALMLLLFGAVHAILFFPGEILTSYGFALLVTGWLLFRSDRAQNIALAVTGVFYLLTVPVVMTAASVGDGSEQGLPGYTTAEDWIERLFGPVVGPLYIAIAYPLLLLVILGYRAGRARLFEKVVERRPLLRTVAWAGVTVSVAGAVPTALAMMGLFRPDPAIAGLMMGVQVLTGVAGGAGYAACFALGADRLAAHVPSVTGAVAAVGRRSLTFYILNSVLVTVVLHVDLGGRAVPVGHFGALVVATLAWCVSVVVAVWLERAGRPGPLEALMRRLVDTGNHYR